MFDEITLTGELTDSEPLRFEPSMTRPADSGINCRLFAARSGITHVEFRTYVARLQLDRTYPDIQAIGYSARTNNENGETYPIVYLEPANSRNERDVGTDVLADPLLRPVLEQARDSA